MKRYLFAFFFFSWITLWGEVYDCFTFFNEIELLKMRFAELSPVVDHFVIVESDISFTGKNKPLYFAENASLFEKYQDKIIHIVIHDFPGLIGDAEKDHWTRERYSRNAIMQGLKNCKNDDVIFISDLDEIPRATAVQKIQTYLSKLTKAKRSKKRKIQNHQFVCSLEMRLFMYQLNRENKAGWLHGAKAVPYWFLAKTTPWDIKVFHHKYNDMHIVPNAGWHFNTMGGKELALFKWLHTGPLFDAEEFLNLMKENEALLDESYQGQVLHNTVPVPIDDTFPKYLIENLDYFRSIGWIADI